MIFQVNSVLLLSSFEISHIIVLLFALASSFKSYGTLLLFTVTVISQSVFEPGVGLCVSETISVCLSINMKCSAAV